jgi:hypothetical protein
VGFEVGYTLLGSKHFVKQLNNPPIMHTTENTNAVVKVGREDMCHVALHTRYNIELTHHKHTIHSKQNQTRQTIERCWFNILDLLRYCDKRDMVWGLACKIWFWGFGWQGQMIRENLNYLRYKW